MNEDPGGDREESSPYLRLPLPIVAGALLGFVVLLMALGRYANRNLRPQISGVATPVVAAPTAPPPPAGAARQSVAATPTPIAVPTAIAVFATQMPGTSTP